MGTENLLVIVRGLQVDFQGAGKNFQDAGTILYLHYGGGCKTISICQNS